MPAQSYSTKQPSTSILPSSCPLQRISLELLHIIFDIARHDSPTAPFTLSHACRKWRSFLLNSPSLWTVILIDRLCSQYYGLWLRRSQNLGLEIQISLRDRRFAHVEMDLLLQELHSSVSRWKEVHLTGMARSDKCFSQVLAWLTAEDFHQLTRLRVVYTPSAEGWSSNLMKLYPMRKLESLEAHAQVLTPSPKWIATCHHLRDLRLTFPDSVQRTNILPYLYQIIQQLSGQLEVLQVHVPHLAMLHRQPRSWRRSLTLPEFPELPKTPISLPRLAKLELSPHPSDTRYFDYAFNPLVPLLHAPNLWEVDTTHVTALEHLEKHNSFPGLHCFGLTDYRLEERENSAGSAADAFTREMVPSFVHVISQLSELRSITFRLIAWHDGEFATALQASCPHLVSLNLQMCFGTREKDLRRLVEGRKASGDVTALQSLSVMRCKGLRIRKMELRWLKEEVDSFSYMKWDPKQAYSILM